MMHILQIGKYFWPTRGGIETVTTDLHREINKSPDFQIDTLVSRWPHSRIEAQELVPESFEKGQVFREPTLGILFSTPISPNIISRMVRLRRKYDFHLVHLPNPLAALAVFLSRPKGKVILFWHSDIINQKKTKFFFNKRSQVANMRWSNCCDNGNFRLNHS